jgi:hypothetical protein
VFGVAKFAGPDWMHLSFQEAGVNRPIFSAFNEAPKAVPFAKRVARVQKLWLSGLKGNNYSNERLVET